MTNDDGKRNKIGVTVSLKQMGDGTSRFIFDDVTSDSDQVPNSWCYDHFFTFSPAFEDAELNQLNISAQDREQIGTALIVRLLALNDRLSESGT